jgi:DNA-binding XRE family transcriptional regulator
MTRSIKTGQEKVLIGREQYEDLIDARDAAIAMADLAAGMPTITDAELDEFLAAKTPLAFWRKRAGMTQAALAARAGVSRSAVARAERASPTVTEAVLEKLAQVLSVRAEDLKP